MVDGLELILVRLLLIFLFFLTIMECKKIEMRFFFVKLCVKK